MDKLDQLWIRACKSANPYTRVMSVHRRFYLFSKGRGAVEENFNRHIVTWLLSELVDKYAPMKVSEVLCNVLEGSTLHPVTPEQQAFEMVVYRLRHTKKSELEGLVSPLRFRIKQ